MFASSSYVCVTSKKPSLDERVVRKHCFRGCLIQLGEELGSVLVQGRGVSDALEALWSEGKIELDELSGILYRVKCQTGPRILWRETLAFSRT